VPGRIWALLAEAATSEEEEADLPRWRRRSSDPPPPEPRAAARGLPPQRGPPLAEERRGGEGERCAPPGWFGMGVEGGEGWPGRWCAPTGEERGEGEERITETLTLM
jgi:hypothetical protein